MKKRLMMLLLSLGFIAMTNMIPSPISVASPVHVRGPRTLVLDVACDARTCRINQVDPTIPQPELNFRRGDTFIVNGKIYPGGTIPVGGTFDHPSPFGPDSPGSIGTWVCRGTFNFSAEEIAAGAAPHVTSTQFFLLDDRTGFVTDGLEGGIPTWRAVLGGTGEFSGVRGEVREEELGINSTGLSNIRFTFTLQD
jgi:hypothetical protein